MYRDQKLCKYLSISINVYFIIDIVVENYSIFSQISIYEKNLYKKIFKISRF